MLVKICGITNIEDALFVTECGADALGFIFVRTSPRYIDPIRAHTIIETVRCYCSLKKTLFVGVFVNSSRQDVNEVLKQCALDCLQFHGEEQPSDVEGYSQKVWKAFRVSDSFDCRVLTPYKVHAYLLDTYDVALYGGTGKTFNWQKAVEAKAYGNIILSGGLKPQNVLKAIETVQPYGIDVNSGVESEPGKKDHQKVKKLFELLKTRMK